MARRGCVSKQDRKYLRLLTKRAFRLAKIQRSAGKPKEALQEFLVDFLVDLSAFRQLLIACCLSTTKQLDGPGGIVEELNELIAEEEPASSPLSRNAVWIRMEERCGLSFEDWVGFRPGELKMLVRKSKLYKPVCIIWCHLFG